MSIQEQITALLNGDLADEGGVAELMHVLAVSPEKQVMLVEQIKMSRAFGAMATGLVPPAAADSTILGALATIDLDIDDASGARSRENAKREEREEDAPVPVPIGWRALSVPVLMMLALLLTGVGAGIGYLLRGNDSVRAESIASSSSTPGDAALRALSPLRDSLARMHSNLSALAAEHRAALFAIDSLRSRPERTRTVYRDRILPAAPVAPTISVENEKPLASIGATRLRADRPTPPAISQERIALVDGGSIPSTTSSIDPGDELPRPGPWQVGLRNLFRLSLPHITGLEVTSSPVFFDRELVLGYRAGASDGALSNITVAAAVGQTRFSQIYHTNTGGQTEDTIIEQAPTLLYARVAVAPELVRTETLSGALEIGGGEAFAGGKAFAPMATFGFNLEYRPVERISLHAGASTWVLWSELRDQTYISTNLNGHLGFSIGF